MCRACNGLGWVFSPATITARIDRWLRRSDMAALPRELTLNVHPAVAAFLLEDGSRRLKDLEQTHGVKIRAIEDESLDQDEFDFFSPGDPKPISQKY